MGTKIGRNAPCPCGSGKKYKKCCLSQNYIEIGKEQSLNRRLVIDLLKFFENNYNDLLEDALLLFWDGFDPVEYFSDEEAQYVEGHFWEWLIYDYPVVDDNEEYKTLIEVYIEKKKKITPDEHNVLKIMNNSTLSLYEVQDVFPGKGLLLKDLLFGKEYDVREKSGSMEIEKWDILACRLLHLDGIYIICGSVFPYTRHRLSSIIQELRDDYEAYKAEFSDIKMDKYLKRCGWMFSELWYEPIMNPPEMRMMNTNGDAIVFSKAHYRIKDKESLLTSLRSIKDLDETEEEDFIWFDSTKDSSTINGHIRIKENILVLECNSKERLAKGKDMLDSIVCEFIEHNIDEYQDLKQAIALSKESPVTQPVKELPKEVQQQVYTDLMDKHYKRWLDKIIPALEGVSPLEAVKTPRGKKQVIELLKDIENTEERNRKSDKPWFDSSWMWDILGIEQDD
ncbi:SEC-C motif domain protein [Candidatus Magnetoovum chiemensis]|nr:SEC-C motif domain protein [Candidatus Magnetoovum chiemensis]